MAAVLEGLRECWPVVGYRVLDSRYWRVAQRRRRVFFIGGPSSECVEQVLFESESGGGDFAARGEARENIAASLRGRSSRPGVNPISGPLCAGRSRGDHYGEESKLIVAACLNSGGNQGGFRTEPGEHLVIAGPLTTGYTVKGHGRSGVNDQEIDCLIPIAEVGAKTQMGSGRNGCGIGNEGDPMFSLQASKQHAVGVRRLTPTECERLQGFPDGWTCLCQPLESYDSNRCTCPDGPRYKTLGNAVTVSVIEWIGRRMLEVEKRLSVTR